MINCLKKLGLLQHNSGVYCGIESIRKKKHIDNLTSISPINLKKIAEVTLASEDDYEKIVSHAKQVYLDLRLMPAPKRGELIKLIGEELRKKKILLAQLITLETGKIIQESLGEVQEMIDFADFAVGQSRMLYGKTMHSERPNHRMYEQWQSLGCIGIITAFNFPVAVWAWNAFIAVVAGNTCIWKPSPKTPLVSIAIHNICSEIIKKHNYPQVFSLLITQDKYLLNKFVQDKRINLISFTGSTETGRDVAVTVAHRLGKCILELGGNNAIIVDNDANMELVKQSVLFSAIGTSGQRCTTARRLLVHEAIYKKLLDNLIEAYTNITIGNPFDSNTLMGPLIDELAIEQYLRVINEIKNQGGEILFGGKRLIKCGCYVQPTLVYIDPCSPIIQRENFSPILFVCPIKSIKQAIQLQNDAAHGLSSSLFSNNIQNIELFLSVAGSDCGIANINIGTSGAEIGGAFGGEKDSGCGREAGSDAWQAYMRRQTNTINWGNDMIFAQNIEFNEKSAANSANLKTVSSPYNRQ